MLNAHHASGAEPTKPLPHIQIYTFGTLRVIRNGQPVDESAWHTRQARQLLKILITERPRPVASDRLIELLWPASTPRTAATTLRSAINALRNVLEPERPHRAPARYVVTQSPGYAFRLQPTLWLDVEAFEAELALARTARGQERRRHLAAAVDLYTDDYLMEDPYADWLQNERERLRERYFNALLQLAELDAAAGDFASAISACRRILARDDVRETAYQALMRYQALSGDSAGALLTFERCRTVLAEELGADPSPLTQQLHQQILNGEIQPAPAQLQGAALRAKEDTTGEDQGPAPLHLPQHTVFPLMDEHFTGVFVGREKERTQLESGLQAALAGTGGLFTLEGEAGVGKTRLACHLLQQAVDAGATVLSATCQALEQQLPFAPLADALGRYLHSLPDTVLHALPPASLAQLAQLIPSLQDRLPELPTRGGDTTIGADENRQRLVDGIVNFLASLARLRPLVLFLDDLHWADYDTLAVLSRLSQRVDQLPLLVLLAYRTDDLAENEALITLLHALRRTRPNRLLPLTGLSLEQVRRMVYMLTGAEEPRSTALADWLYAATQGNALFVTEALRDLMERFPGQPTEERTWRVLVENWSQEYEQLLSLRRNQRIQELILERIQRLPPAAREVLQLAAAIGRDFSVELLEAAAPQDPMAGLATLLERRFLLEQPDARLDFSHAVVRQVAYDNLNALQRRRLHRQIAEALVSLQRAEENPRETAFHFSQAGPTARQEFAYYSVLAGERLARTFGFRQAIEHFDQALDVLAGQPDAAPELVQRALQGRGLAYESLLDAEGVLDTYRRLQAWANQRGDRDLLLAAHSRLTTLLALLGQQRESNQLLSELMETLTASEHPVVRSQTIADLLARRRLIYSPDTPDDGATWARYTPPPPVPGDPVAEILALLAPFHAVLPLFDYGWTLLVQGQLPEATRCLEAVVSLARETGQLWIASTAYHQLAAIARLQGDLERSYAFNEQSMALNQMVPGVASELASMWPRIASAFLSLRTGRLDEAERRLQRVVDFLAQRPGFENYRNSAFIGLGLVALERGEHRDAREWLEKALADPVNLYPYTHVRALMGLARLAHLEGQPAARDVWLRRALRFAGRRSLLEEYVDVVLTLADLRPPGAPVEQLLREMLSYVGSLGLDAMAQKLRQAYQAHKTSAIQP
ncbi:AAA family ATPase [Litorilinea aerophila]|uniref:AAA family ATPase n=1 Tax=Litorilinea aerophila TaxID=1204385 RepID=A0A540VCI5_9CHLR|nr:AAA family ATPase [Litorilinea aerophila]MCC9077690.1 AAA family ATPase [Litorilinea aerophila]